MCFSAIFNFKAFSNSGGLRHFFFSLVDMQFFMSTVMLWSRCVSRSGCVETFIGK